jgi:DNA-binding GntR family transcriptional regulator
MTEATLRHPSLRELIARELRAQILGRELSPGEKLDVGAIAAQYGVSMNSVREAAFLLESEGLVVVNPRRGITVRVVTPAELLEIYAVREIIEIASATLVASANDAGVLDMLRAGQERIEQAWDAGGFAAGLAADLELHVLFAELSGNSQLLAISSNLADQTRLHLQPVEATDASIRARPPADLHTAIIEAMVVGDEEEIRKAVADHYAFSRTRVTHE